MLRKKALKISMTVHIRAYMKPNSEYINLNIIKDTQILLYFAVILLELIVDCGGKYCIKLSLCL